jgi:histidine triad (HIT) family protein
MYFLIPCQKICRNLNIFITLYSIFGFLLCISFFSTSYCAGLKVANSLSSYTSKSPNIKKNEQETIFHKIISGKIPSTKVWEDDEVYAFRDINPVAKTHIIVIPKKMNGLNMLSSAKEEHIPILGKLLYAVSLIAKQEKLDKGYRVVINCNKQGCQSVPYLHLHLIGGEQLGWPPTGK